MDGSAMSDPAVTVQAPTPGQVKAARVAAGLTQRECAEQFGYTLRGWQNKEDAGGSGRTLSVGEYNYLLLLAGEHPDFELRPHSK